MTGPLKEESEAQPMHNVKSESIPPQAPTICEELQRLPDDDSTSFSNAF